ncbi:MAG: hypothetical protein SF052_17445 [Bacteroidia bacterium]|nr:hypothetical protein [Bacteroidia bacterium]
MANQQQFIHAKCPECGQQMLYAGGNKSLSCKNCGYNRPLNAQTDQIPERKLTDNIRMDDFVRGMGTELTEFSCNSCKAILISFRKEPMELCPFCGKKEFTASKQNEKVIQPFSIIPFMIPEVVARKILRSHLKSLYPVMLPGDIWEITEENKLRGVFIPWFLFDVFTRSTWKGEGGIEVNDGKQKKMVWDNFAGYLERHFTDLPIGGSKGSPGHLSEVANYNFRDAVNYDPHYLSLFATELYQSAEKDVFTLAEAAIDVGIMLDIETRLKKTNERKNFKITTEKQALTFRHILVPLWIGIYSYQGKTFKYLINGQTGKVAGEKPLSMNKIYSIIAFIIVLMITLVLSLR